MGFFRACCCCWGGGVLAQDLALNAPTFSSRSEGDSGHTDNTFQVTLTQAVAGNVDYMLCFSSASSGENYATRNDDFRLIKGGVEQNGRMSCHRSVIRAGQTNTATRDLIGIRVLGDTAVEPDEKVDVELIPLIYVGDGVTHGDNITYDYTVRSHMKYNVSLTPANAQQSFTILNDDQPRVVTRPPPKPLYHHHVRIYSDTGFYTGDTRSGVEGTQATDAPNRRRIRVQLVKNPKYDNIKGTVGFKVCIRPDPHGGTATRDRDGTWHPGDDYRLIVRNDRVSAQCRSLQTFSNGFSSNGIWIEVRKDADIEPDETVVLTVELLSEEHQKLIKVEPFTYTIINDDLPVAANPEVTIAQTGGAVDEGELAEFGVKIANPPGTVRPPGVTVRRIKVAARVPWTSEVWTTSLITAGEGNDHREWFQVPTNGVTGDYHLCAWVLPGNNYTIGGTSGQAPTTATNCPSGHTVLVRAAQGTTTNVKSSGQDQDDISSRDNDGNSQAGDPPPDHSELKATLRGYADETQHGQAHVDRWKRALAGLGDEDAIAEGHAPMTAAEAQDMADTYTASRWDPVVEALTELESREAEPEPDPIPELSLSGGGGVDEGGSASFTIHADPAPAADVTVSVAVVQSGDYLDAPGAGTRTVTLAAGATTASVAIATVNDSADEPDGSVSVSLDAGTGYTVASSNGSATVAVRDDDEPTPEVSVSSGGDVTEGGSASFTVTASPAPASPLDVAVTVAQSGDFAASGQTGSRTVTIPSSGSATLTVATEDDGADEPDGSVSVSLDAGAGYTVSSPSDTASVAVRDNDEPPPAVTADACVSISQWKTVKGYYDANANKSPNYGANWYRVLIAYRQDGGGAVMPDWVGATAEPTAAYTVKEAKQGEKLWSGWTPVRLVLECLERTYGGTSTSSVIGGITPTGLSGEVGATNPEPATGSNRWNPQTAPGGFGPDAMPDFAAGACVSPQLRSEATARARETWRGPAHVERWLRVAQTFSGGANDALIVTPAEAGFHAAAGQPGWMPVADALRCMEQRSLREAMSR